MFGRNTLRLALPIPWLVTFVLALLVLWGLIAVYGATSVVLIGWLIGWLIVSRAVNWLVARRRKALRPLAEPPSDTTPEG